MYNLKETMHGIEHGKDLESVRLGIIEILHSIVSHSSEFDAVWHPLGLMYIKLGRFERKTLRLHVWFKEVHKVELLTSPIHNHIWHLTSYVLCGSIINYEIECVYQPDTPTYRLYEIGYEGPLNVLRPTAFLVACKIKSTLRLNPGDRYTIDPGEFHYTQLASPDIAATVVVAEDIATTPPMSLGPIQGQTYRMIRPKCLPEEISKAGQAVLSVIPGEL